MKPRTREFRDKINLALEQAGLDGRLEYSDVEALLHMTFDKGNKRIPWFQNHKQTILYLEDGIENVLLTVAGYAFSAVTPESEDEDITYAFLRAMHDWRDQYRRQFDPGGELPNGDRYWLQAHPTAFGAIEEGARKASGGEEPADYALEQALINWGANLEVTQPEHDLPDEFDDDRLAALWEAADSEEREMLELIGAGMALSHAGQRLGHGSSWAGFRLKRLKEKVGV